MTIPVTDLTAVTPSGPVEAADGGRTKRRKWRFVANPKAAVGLGTLAFYLLIAIIGPWIAPFDPDARSNALVQGPSSTHWFGTTHLGQDIFSQLLIGTRGVMFVGFLAGIVAMALSVLIGITAGYLGGVMDECLSVLTNVFLVIPALPLIIIISATVKSAGDLTVALTIGGTSWAWGARILRAQTLSLRQRDYVQASRATGETTWRIIVFELMPNLVAIIASSFVSTVIFAVMSEITLAFIGVSNVSTWNWGTILFWAQSEQALAQGAWWWFVPAGLAIAILGTALALLNFGIDEFVSPRLRSSGATKVRTMDGAKVRMKVGFTPVLMSRKRLNHDDLELVGMNGAGPGPRAGRSSTVTPVIRPVVEQVEPKGADQ
jgi:peptide/nickel transport system permease protein